MQTNPQPRIVVPVLITTGELIVQALPGAIQTLVKMVGLARATEMDLLHVLALYNGVGILVKFHLVKMVSTGIMEQQNAVFVITNAMVVPEQLTTV